MGKLILAIFISILIIIGMIIINSHNISLEEQEGRKEFVIEYWNWLVNIGDNVKSTAGYVIKQNWKINATTNNTKIK